MTKAATLNCVVCFGPRTHVGGHVHKGEEKVFASTCDEHWGNINPKEQEDKGECKGCFGEWSPEMGYEAGWMQFGYIDKEGFHEQNIDNENRTNL